MKKNLLFLLFAAAAVCSAAPVPVYEWDFERTVNKDYLESRNRAGRKLWMLGKAREKAGVGGTRALDCHAGSYNYIAKLDMPWKEFTVDFQFKLDNPVNEKNGNTLIWYAAHSWGRSDFLFKITPKKELTARFFTKDDKSGKITLNYAVTTKPLDIQPGKFHSVRLSSASGGNLKIWFDGVLVAAKDKAKSFSDLTPGSESYYPMLIVGGEARTAKPRFQLDGVIDDLKIFNEAAEPDADDASASPSVSDVKELFTPLSLRGKAVTSRFNVLDVDVQAGAVFKQADRIFREHAATASIEIKGDDLEVIFNCPVSPKHPVDRNSRSFWNGELVEFFWSSDPAAGYYQYAYNAALRSSNASAYRANRSRIAGWSSSFRADFEENADGFRVKMTIPCREIGLDPSDGRKVYRANFTRCGKSAGGRSSWAAIGQNFHDPDAFGSVINGSLADYHTMKLEELLKKDHGKPLPETLVKKIDALRSFIADRGGTPENFAAVSRRIANLENDLVMHVLSGRKLIIAQPDMWSNDLSPGLLTRPVERFRVRMARGTAAFVPFAVSNMTDRRFLCRIKLMDKLPPEKFDTYPAAPFPLDGGFREAVPNEDNSGRTLYDALVDLPMGQLLRVPAGETAAVWLKLNSSGIAPGLYRTNVVLKSAAEGFADEIIPLEVEVLPVDLGKVETDTALYNYIQSRFVNSFSAPKEELLKYLAERGVNYIYCNVPGDRDLDIYPPLDADGRPGKCDFTHLDNNIDSYLRCGMDRSRVKLWFYLAMDYPGYVLTNRGKHCPYKEFSPQWKGAVESFFKQLFSHLREKYGITPDRVVFIPVDEPGLNSGDGHGSIRKACEYAKFIKSIVPQTKLMANPFDFRNDAVWRENFARLAECFDIISPYSGQLVPELVEYIKTLPFKEFWTYNILQKIHGPEQYCLKLWENMRNGFSTVSPYWHTDRSDGGDGICSFDVSYGVRRNDYSTIYCDFTGGRGIVSRRQEAYFLGCQDAKLIILCRRLAKGRPEAATVEAIVAKGAAGDMRTIGECREALLDMAMKLGGK